MNQGSGQASVQITPLGHSTLVKTGPNRAIPNIFSAYVDDPSQPFLLELRVEMTAGQRPQVVDLRIEQRDGMTDGVTTERLRGVQVARALALAIDRAQSPGYGSDSLDEDSPPSAAPETLTVRPLRGIPIPDAFLAQVAEVYRSAVASGSRKPVVEVCTQLGGSRASAGRWVGQAREAGFLRAAIGTRAGETTPTSRKKAGTSSARRSTAAKSA